MEVRIPEPIRQSKNILIISVSCNLMSPVIYYVPPRPQLEVEKTGDSLTASWPLSAIDWTIETTTDLSDPNSWEPVANPPTDADFFHTMTFDVTGTNRVFFRLKK
jgi:hypothetical protein